MSRRLKTHVMDKYGLINKIQKLNGLTTEEKSALLKLLREHKRYGLVWEDKPEAVEDELKTQLPVLKEVKERAIINDSETEHYPNHILIEGDNLHALTVLSYTHAGSIDVIYIDPPYNTGHKDFVYNDNFVDPEDIYRHSKWLSFMNRRLKIAKKLLSDKGVIFISIDDNEQANLKLLCDKIFGAQNFICNFIWKSKSGGANDSRYVAIDHEYILCYGKMISDIPKMMDRYAVVTTSYNRKDNKGEYSLDRLDKQSIRYSDSLNYEIKDPEGRSYWPQHKDPAHPNATWRWSKEHVKNNYEDLVFWKGFVYTKNYRKQSTITRSILYEDRFGRTRTGKTDFYAIMRDNSMFNAPKPAKLISFLISISSNKNSTILDFFAGSGTTLHATMQLNAEDGGHRQCILVTNNENGICENVTYERNRRVIEGYTTPKGEHVDGLTHNNLRYYKTDFVPRQKAPKNMRALVSAATDMLCIKENMYHEVAQFGPWKALPDFALRHFTDDKGGEMLIIYREGVIEEVVDALVGMKFKKKLKIYVFSPDRDPYANEFEEVEDKVELCALPAAIYDAYREVMPKADDPLVPYTEHGETVSMDDDEEEGKEETR